MEIRLIKLHETFNISDELAACIGYFDGFHKGHQGLFYATLTAAKNKGLKSAVITFNPDPWVAIKGLDENAIEHISTLKDRQIWAEKLGFDYFIELSFTKEMASLSPVDFINFVLTPMHIKHLVCGFDFHFGAMGKGNPTFLREIAQFEVEEIKEITYLGSKISSTRICEAITSGNMELARALLTRPYTLTGEVVHGRAKGRKIGFPTANIKLLGNYVPAKPGVYIGKVKVDNSIYKAMINIGFNPTFNLQERLSIEAHILDFQGEIYGKEIQVMLYSYLRSEQKFDSISELQEVLAKNVIDTKRYFKEN